MRKVPTIKKLGKLEQLSTVQLLGYADMSHSTMNEVMEKGKDLYNAQYLKMISAEDNQPNLEKLQSTLNQYADAHNAIVKELGNRLKKDMKFDKSPIQITSMIQDIESKIPALAEFEPRNRSRQLQNLAQEKAAKDRADASEKARKEAEAKAESEKKEKPKAKTKKLKAVKDN